MLQAIIIIAVGLVIAIVPERLIELLAWVEQPIFRGRLEHELNCGVYKAFAEHGIQIPFPQQDLYIKTPNPQLPFQSGP